MLVIAGYVQPQAFGSVYSRGEFAGSCCYPPRTTVDANSGIQIWSFSLVWADDDYLIIWGKIHLVYVNLENLNL